MDAVLQRFGFGPGFRKWIRLLYDDPQSRLRINNETSAPFSLHRGVRLFVLCLEPLLTAIRADPTVVGALLPDGSHLKASAFADDATLFPSTAGDIERCEFWMSTYEAATGSSFSKAKSEALIYGFDPPATSLYFSAWQRDPSYKFRFLGVTCSLTLDLSAAWEAATATFTATLNAWRPSSLSLHGKTVVLRHFAYPILTYLASFLPVPPDTMESVRRASWKFLWSGKKAKANLETCKILPHLGGLGYPDFGDVVPKLQAKWAIRLLRE